ncbi:MAG: nucleotidyltransferase family protein [Firmicutes bacterium]|nr:nucleotidyltransferase family protein [Bacillota bacterium]
MNELQKTTDHLVYLIRCVLHQIAPEIGRVEEMDLTAVIGLAQKHMLNAAAVMALEMAWKAGLSVEEEQKKTWLTMKDRQAFKNLKMDIEREAILQILAEEGIWSMPLKGSILAGMYPKIGMRQMGDNDILFDASYAEKVKEIMEGRGYKTLEFGVGNHDVYDKPPFYHFEMHTSLLHHEYDPEWLAYYENVTERLVKDGYHYSFTDEDFYIFMIVHAYKHYSVSGTGLRTLVDEYVYLQKKGESLNWEYVQTELTKLKMAEFEGQIRRLADKLFKEGSQAVYGEEQLDYIITSGTYGTVEHRVSNWMDAMEDGEMTWKRKVRYVWRRFFPTVQWYKDHFKICRKYVWMIPFCWIFRIVRGIFCRRERLKRELETVRKK